MAFLKAVTTVGGYTMASRVLGLVRDVLTATFLGAGPVADAFFIALKLPNFFRRITAEGAFSFSFVPMFSKMLSNKKDAKEFAEEAQAVMIATLLPFTIVAVVAMPWLLYVVAPGIYDEPMRFMHALEFSRITFPYILMISLTALLGGVLNSLDKFAAFAIAPIFFNIVLILALLINDNLFATTGHALSWGVFVAGIVQFVWMLWNAKRSGFALKLRKPKITPRMRKLGKLMVPGIVGAGAVQINLLVDLFLASFLPIGSISLLYYADRLYQLPLGVIGIAIGTALLPMLSRAIKRKNGSSEKLFTTAFESALALALPAAVGLMVISEPIIAVLFERGEFMREDTIGAAYALTAYAFGLPAYVLARVFSVAFYAREDTKTPVKFAITSAVINIALAIVLIFPFKHVGIAMATAIAAWVNLGLLANQLLRNEQLDLSPASLTSALKIAGAAVAMGIVLYGLNNYVVDILGTDSFIKQLLGLVILIGSGMAFYFSLLAFTGVFTVSSIKAMFKSKGEADLANLPLDDQ